MQRCFMSNLGRLTLKVQPAVFEVYLTIDEFHRLKAEFVGCK